MKRQAIAEKAAQGFKTFKMSMSFSLRKEHYENPPRSHNNRPKTRISLHANRVKVCILQFITGESITVVCGVKTTDNSTVSFPGTPEDLKELLAEYMKAD